MIKLPVVYNSLNWKQRKVVREKYCRLQNNKCLHCGASLEDVPVGKAARAKINKSLFPSNFFDYPVHLHHCHKTGLTIGAVHNVCNAYFWQYEGK